MIIADTVIYLIGDLVNAEFYDGDILLRNLERRKKNLERKRQRERREARQRISKRKYLALITDRNKIMTSNKMFIKMFIKV